MHYKWRPDQLVPIKMSVSKLGIRKSVSCICKNKYHTVRQSEPV